MTVSSDGVEWQACGFRLTWLESPGAGGEPRGYYDPRAFWQLGSGNAWPKCSPYREEVLPASGRCSAHSTASLASWHPTRRAAPVPPTSETRLAEVSDKGKSSLRDSYVALTKDETRLNVFSRLRERTCRRLTSLPPHANARRSSPPMRLAKVTPRATKKMFSAAHRP